MKIKLFTLVLFISVLFSCKNSSAEKTEVAQPESQAQDNSLNEFFVELDLISQKDDAYVVYYTEDGTTNFTEKQALWTQIEKGSPNLKTIKFLLPEGAKPTHFRIDFGNNKDQETVELYKIKFSYFGKKFEIKGSEFYTYFSLNPNVKTEIDASKGTIKFLKNPKEFFSPMYFPMPKLVEEISKLIN